MTFDNGFVGVGIVYMDLSFDDLTRLEIELVVV